MANDIQFTIGATDNTAKDFDELKASLADLEAKRAAISVNVNDKDAVAKMASLDLQAARLGASLDKLGKKNEDPNVDIVGIAKANADLAFLDQRLDAVNEKKTKETVDSSDVEKASSFTGLLVTGALALGPAFAVAATGAAAFGALAIPAIEKAVQGTGPLAAGLKSVESEYKAVAASVQPEVISDFNEAIQAASKILPEFSGVAEAGGKAVGVLVSDFASFATSQGTKQFLSFVGANTTSDMNLIGHAVTQLGTGLEGLIEALNPLGKVIIPIIGDLGNFVGAVSRGDPMLVQFAVAAAGVALAYNKLASAGKAVAKSQAFGALFDVPAFTTAISLIKDVTSAEDAMAVAGAAVDAINPLGWLVLIGGAIAGTIGALDHFQNKTVATGQTIDQMNHSVGSSVTAYKNMASGYQSAAATMIEAGAQLSGATAIGTAGYQAQTATAVKLNAALDPLARQYGVTEDQVMKWASAAGIADKAWTGNAASVDGANQKLIRYLASSNSVVANFTALDMAAEGSTQALNALDTAWNNLVGNFVTEQQAIVNAKQAVQSFGQAVKQSGAGSLAAQSAFYAAVQSIGQMQQAMDKAHAPAKQMYEDTEDQIKALKEKGPLNAAEKTALDGLQADAIKVANSTQGMTKATQDAAKALDASFIPDLKSVHANTPLVNTDIKNLTDAIINTGKQSAATHGDRQQLIKDLESVGLQSGQAKALVKDLIGEINAIPKNHTTTVKVDGQSAEQTIDDIAREVNNLHGKSVNIYVNTFTDTIARRGGAAGGAIAWMGAAGGGPRSGLTLVGEQGPELVSIPGGSTVHSNSDSQHMLAGGGGGGPVNVTFEIGGSGNAGFDSFMLTWLKQTVRVKGGGNVQAALGRG